MKFNSIATKLWLIITFLIMLVLAVATATQTSLMDKFYYQTQTKQMISLGKKIAYLASQETDRNILDIKLKAMSELMDGNIMIISKDKTLLSCQGMGVSTEEMLLDLKNPHHSPLAQEDLQKLYRGETVIHKGPNEYFNTDLLTVAVPVNQPGNSNVGYVIMHSPLKPMEGQLSSLKILTIYTAVGSILLATVLGLYFSRRVSRPIQDMSHVALAMASGDFSRQVPVDANDEVSVLAGSLNTLSNRLQEKLTQLEKLEQIRREFVANVSHEMKTPLTVMQVLTESLQDDLVSSKEEKQTYLNNIHDEILRLRRLVNEVLDLKKMEEGHDHFDKEYVNLQELADSVQSKLNTFAMEASVNLQFHINKKLSPLYINRDRIEQVFINLVDNALRHTPSNGQVLVTAEPKAGGVVIKVQDTGCGIPPEDLPMIWERFFKVDKARTRGKSGTGLGLAIVKRIVEAHGGCIDIQSRLGEGTTFTIILPSDKPQ